MLSYRKIIHTQFVYQDLHYNGDDYLKWVIHHELRHCEPKGDSKFRSHDVFLHDIGFDDPKPIGFFVEDFEEIAQSNQLKGLFSNVLNIDDPEYTKWMKEKHEYTRV